ncbi:RNA polymerase sigma factor [Emticicia sp. 17c]|uniref:RNA polymerase sigma factor n=1 Tax=Emticicia sp. 17c TaxID=3127704 RepID=UPI00301E3AD0
MLQVKAGDLDKMGLLFERYHRPLFGFLYHMTGDNQTSEDLVQNVFYRMLKYRHTFTAEGEFHTWMYHLARNVLNDSYKKNRHNSQHYDVDAFAERIGGGVTADEELEKQQDTEMLQRALDKLSPEYKEVLIMSRYQDLKYDEIATILNTSEGAIKVRVHRAMNELKKHFLKIENGNKAHEL